MNAIGRIAAWAAAAAALIAVAAQAQEPDACTYLTPEEFSALTGKPSYGDPEAMALRAGSVCGFDGGQVIVFSGASAQTEWEALMARFNAGGERTPAPEVGPDAYAFFVEPENAYQSPAAFIAFSSGANAVAVSVDGEDDESAQAALPAAISVAKAVAAKLE